MKRLAISSLSALLASAAAAQPPGQEVLDSVELYERAGCAVTEVRFHMPTAYLSHFPLSEGAFLRIDVQLLQRTDALAVGRREAARLNDAPPFRVRWLDFEARAQGRGVVYADFSEVTRFTVTQGADFRSILIAVPAQDGIGVCNAEDIRDRP